MIALPKFEIHSPGSLAEATAMSTTKDGLVRILAGGTDLVVNMKHGLEKPARLVWLGKLSELRTISVSPEHALRIGAMCTLNEIAASSTVQQFAPVLAEAACAVASPAIRNSATLGGNLCQDTRCFYFNQSEFWRGALGGCIKARIPSAPNGSVCHATPGLAACTAVFCSDLAPILIALNASVKLINQRRERVVDLIELYREDGANHLTLNTNEIIAELSIPAAASNQFSAFKKIRDRRSIDFALANVGVDLLLDAELLCRRAKIVVGAVQSAPIQCKPAEAMLLNNKLTRELIDRAAVSASSTVSPVPNVEEPVGYRKKMVRVLVQRALLDVWSKASGESYL